MKLALLAPSFFFVCTIFAADTESSYFHLRDQLIAKINAKADLMGGSKDEKAALDQLEKTLQNVIGKLKVQGHPEPPKINLEALVKGDLGFAEADGLKFFNQEETLVVSTNGLLKPWLTEEPEIALKKKPHNIFFSGVAIEPIVKIPVSTGPNLKFVYAYLSAIVQEYGPFTPRSLVVYAQKGRQVFGIARDIQAKLPTFATCVSAYNDQIKKLEKLSLKTRFKEEEKTFKTYATCYGKALEKDSSYDKVKKLAQEIIERLEKSEVSS